MTNQTSLTDELTGNSSTVQTDHGGLEFGDLIVLLLDLVLLIYTGWRSYDFLSTTVPNGYQMLALVGLWGLDIGAVAWSLVWVFGSTEKYQDWTSLGFFVIDLVGVVMTSLTDSLMYGAKGGTMTNSLTGIAVVVIPLVVVGNVIAGFIYHMTSPATRARREARKEAAQHKRNMDQVSKMERELLHAESYLLAKQDTLEKASILAEIKIAQDAIEKATRDQLRDQVGIHFNAKSGAASSNSSLDQLKARILELRQKLTLTNDPDASSEDTSASSTSSASAPSTPSLPQPVDASTLSAHPSMSPKEGDQNILEGPEPVAVNGNGHSKQDPM